MADKPYLQYSRIKRAKPADDATSNKLKDQSTQDGKINVDKFNEIERVTGRYLPNDSSSSEDNSYKKGGKVRGVGIAKRGFGRGRIY